MGHELIREPIGFQAPPRARKKCTKTNTGIKYHLDFLLPRSPQTENPDSSLSSGKTNKALIGALLHRPKLFAAREFPRSMSGVKDGPTTQKTSALSSSSIKNTSSTFLTYWGLVTSFITSTTNRP